MKNEKVNQIHQLFRTINLLTEIVGYVDDTDRDEISFVNKALSDAVRNNRTVIKLRTDASKIITVKEIKEISEKFPSIKELVLENEGILDAAMLKEMSLFQIERLEINKTNIGDFSELALVKLPKLQTLIITENKIKNVKIEFLLNSTYNNLKYLDLSGNELTDNDVEILKNTNLINLKTFYLKCNNITNLSFLSEIKFKNLIELDFRCNNVISIDFLREEQFSTLQIFYAYFNKISDLSPFESPHLISLTHIYLAENEISGDLALAPFTLPHFKELKELKLSGNKITSLEPLKKGNFTNLTIWIFKNSLSSKTIDDDLKKTGITFNL